MDPLVLALEGVGFSSTSFATLGVWQFDESALLAAEEIGVSNSRWRRGRSGRDRREHEKNRRITVTVRLNQDFLFGLGTAEQIIDESPRPIVVEGSLVSVSTVELEPITVLVQEAVINESKFSF